METPERTSLDAFEAILAIESMTRGDLTKAIDLVSDLLDIVHDTRVEICGLLEKGIKTSIDARLDSSEGALISAQHYLNSILTAANDEKTVK